jgi:hypothetical protein
MYDGLYSSEFALRFVLRAQKYMYNLFLILYILYITFKGILLYNFIMNKNKL